MDNKLKSIIFKYLDNTYGLDLDTLQEYKVLLKTDNTRISISSMYDDVRDMFAIHPYNCSEFFNEWIDMTALKLNNQMVDDLYDTYTSIRTTKAPPIMKFYSKETWDNKNTNIGKLAL